MWLSQTDQSPDREIVDLRSSISRRLNHRVGSQRSIAGQPDALSGLKLRPELPAWTNGSHLVPRWSTSQTKPRPQVAPGVLLRGCIKYGLRSESSDIINLPNFRCSDSVSFRRFGLSCSLASRCSVSQRSHDQMTLESSASNWSPTTTVADQWSVVRKLPNRRDFGGSVQRLSQCNTGLSRTAHTEFRF